MCYTRLLREPVSGHPGSVWCPEAFVAANQFGLQGIVVSCPYTLSHTRSPDYETIETGRTSRILNHAVKEFHIFVAGCNKAGKICVLPSGGKGRKKVLSQAKVTELRPRIAAGMSKAQVAREFGSSRQTLYQYLREAEGTPEV
jgi:hypothetical protein